MKCPMCGKGILKKGTIKKTIFGVYLGDFPAEICTSCNESFTDSETMQKIEDIAKKKGIWGLSRKTKITQTGNSLAIVIPKDLATHLNLKKGTEACIHPEKDKLVIEPC